jgi:hypothetical protein
MDRLGRDVTKVVMLNLGPQGPADDRLKAAGISVVEIAGQVEINDVQFGSEAARNNLEPGTVITEILLPDPDRLPKEIMFIPALILVAGIFFLQRRRPSKPVKANA